MWGDRWAKLVVGLGLRVSRAALDFGSVRVLRGGGDWFHRLRRCADERQARCDLIVTHIHTAVL